MVPVPLDDDDAASMVLERAAQALAISPARRTGPAGSWATRPKRGFLTPCVSPGGSGEDEAQARAAALGLQTLAWYYVPIVFRSGGAAYGTSREATAAGDDPLAGQQEERVLLEQLARALKSVSGSALTASIRLRVGPPSALSWPSRETARGSDAAAPR